MDIAASHHDTHQIGLRQEGKAVTAKDWGLLILRLGLATVFLAHGGQKVFGWFGGIGLAGTAAGMHSGLGIPVPLAYVASFTELLGGLAVLLGILARLGALGIAVNMVVAICLVHLKNGFFITPGAVGFEYAFTLLIIALSIVVAGPGRIAIGDFEARPFIQRHETAPG